MNYRYLKKSAVALVVIFLVFGAQMALASGVYQNLRTAAGTDLTKNGDILTMIGSIVKVLLSMLGVVLVIIILYAGVLWGFLSNGDSAKIKKAKEMLINAVIGLLIVFASYAITAFVMTSIAGASGGSGNGGVVDYPVH